MIKFGPAGISENFYEKGFKKSIQIPAYLKDFGLNAFEYQCGNGVNISEKTAAELGEECIKNDITPSIHAPYYISLSSTEQEKRIKSIDYILKTAAAANAMKADRIIVHSGSCAKMTREEALNLSADTLQKAFLALKENKMDSIHICPETMGKINQLGTLEEVMFLCSLNETFIPTVDFGHLNARTFGGIKTKKDYSDILDIIENKLGYDRLKYMHCHFSKIQYTIGGEKKHLTFEDTEYGPSFEPLAELLIERDLKPTIICESDSVMDKDALEMKNIYYELKNKRRE